MLQTVFGNDRKASDGLIATGCPSRNKLSRYERFLPITS